MLFRASWSTMAKGWARWLELCSAVHFWEKLFVCNGPEASTSIVTLPRIVVSGTLGYSLES